MFIRTKKSSSNARTYVQLVESYREDGRIRQRMVRHIGTAKNPEEVQALKQVGMAIKQEFEQMKWLYKAVPEKKTQYATLLGRTSSVSESETLSLAHAQEIKRKTLGIHDAYGWVYDTVGFENLFTLPQKRVKSAHVLREMVLARIAKPTSKRASIEILEEEFDVQIPLHQVYQMMDKIDQPFCDRLQERALATALRLTGETLRVLFYDATTLYFESFTEDDLKQNGYSKDLKFNQPQVLLALFVTEKGLPVGYEVFPGKTFEGHTLKPVLEKLKFRYQLKEVVFVADRGMLSTQNLDYLCENHLHYIVGSRLKSLKKRDQDRVLSWINSLDKASIEEEVTHRIPLSEQQSLILSYRASRAKKDQADREEAIQKLEKRLSRSKNPKQLISNYGYQKFIQVSGESKLELDPKKMLEASAWDGVVGVVTNHKELSDEEILSQYRGLWQVEESFRITKHDLGIRPIYHWTPHRVRAHIAISFMSLVCVRYLEYRISTQHQKTSPEQIRKSLLRVQASVIHDQKSDKKYLIPSQMDPLSKQIYRILGIKMPSGCMKLASK